MKNIKLVAILILVLIVLIIAGNCATGKKASVTDKDIYKILRGTWINKDYDEPPGSEPSAKIILKNDGVYEEYTDSSSTSPVFFGEIIAIDEKWIDSEGNIWFKSMIEYLGHKIWYYRLDKIHRSGKVWEFNILTYEYPKEINPNHSRYRIYYRQE